MTATELMDLAALNHAAVICHEGVLHVTVAGAEYEAEVAL